jgi:hypothetical protein
LIPPWIDYDSATFMKENLFHLKKPRPESARICGMGYSMHIAAVNLGRMPPAKWAEKINRS